MLTEEARQSDDDTVAADTCDDEWVQPRNPGAAAAPVTKVVYKVCFLGWAGSCCRDC